MFYRTRHLEALKEHDHEGLRKPGDRYYATEVDAAYLTQHGRAKSVEDGQQAQAQAPATPAAPESKETVPPARRRRVPAESAAAPSGLDLVVKTTDLPGPAADAKVADAGDGAGHEPHL